MGFSRQEYWSGLSCPPAGDLPDSGIKCTCFMSPALEAGSLPLAPPGNPHLQLRLIVKSHYLSSYSPPPINDVLFFFCFLSCVRLLTDWISSCSPCVICSDPSDIASLSSPEFPLPCAFWPDSACPLSLVHSCHTENFLHLCFWQWLPCFTVLKSSSSRDRSLVFVEHILWYLFEKKRLIESFFFFFFWGHACLKISLH